MSNVGRPRTGLKPCPNCGSTARDTNGQCACRNALYRITRRAATDDVARIKKSFDTAIGNGSGDVEEARAVVAKKFPYLAKKAPAKKAPAKKAAKGKKAAAAKKAAAPKPSKKAQAQAPAAPAPKPEPAAPAADPKARYLLQVEGEAEPRRYARKDAAVKNGVRSGKAWEVLYKAKVVAASSDLL
jgi:hypothetical protein